MVYTYKMTKDAILNVVTAFDNRLDFTTTITGKRYNVVSCTIQEKSAEIGLRSLWIFSYCIFNVYEEEVIRNYFM